MTFRALCLLLTFTCFATAHEVPDDVRISIFVKPAGNRMRIIVRVPVNALIDTQLPVSEGPGYLIVPDAIPMLPTAARVWVSDLLVLKENVTSLDRPRVIQTRLSRMSDTSFVTYEQALAHMNGPDLPANALITWDRAALDVLLETPISSAQSAFTFTPRFGRLGVRVTTTLTFLPSGGGQRIFEYEGDPEPYELNPVWNHAAFHFVRLGFLYILSETDHLLFLFCAVLLCRRFRTLIPFVAAFAVAHSAVLIAAAYNRGPGASMVPALAGTTMALAIVYLALESVVRGIAPRQRWIMAVVSGIFFGSGFWFFLQPELQFGGEHPLASVLSFNSGIELALALAIAIMLPAVNLVFRFALADKIGTIILAGLAAHIAWHRMTDRALLLSRLPLQWPAISFVSIALFAVVLAASWFVFGKSGHAATAPNT